MPYAIYLEYQEIWKTNRFEVLPSGALECRDEWGGAVKRVFAPGSWDRVAYIAPKEGE